MARVVALTPILHDGVLYEIGEQIEMSDVQEQRLVDAAEAAIIPAEEIAAEEAIIPAEEIAAASKANTSTK